MFPLKQRKIGGYKFGDKTFYNSFHIGVDYVANQTPLYAPFDGGVTTSFGPQGGNTIHFWPDHDKVEIRFLHLAKFIKTGRVKQGDLIAITGNTGNETTKPHLHLDISKGSLQLNNIKNFIDPEKYNWEYTAMTTLPITLVTTQSWTQAQVDETRQMILQASDNSLDVQVSTLQKALTPTFTQYPEGKRVDDNWYRQNILPLCSGVPMLHLSNSEWQGTDRGDETQDGIQFHADENSQTYFSQSNVTVKDFVQNFVHELCHRLYRTTGQADLTHQFMYPPTGVWNPHGAYSQLDYSKLTQQKGKETMILFQEKGKPAIYSFGSGDTLEPFTDQRSLTDFINGRPYQVVQLDSSEIQKFVISKPFIKE